MGIMPTKTWERIARDIAGRIHSGETPVGARIASLQQLAARNKASIGSAKRAVRDLTERGVLEGRSGSGVFVIALPEAGGPTLEQRVEALEREVAELKRQSRPD